MSRLSYETRATLAFIGIVAIVLGIFAAIVVPVALISHHNDHVQCVRFSERYNVETKYIGSCQVKVGNHWVSRYDWEELKKRS